MRMRSRSLQVRRHQDDGEAARSRQGPEGTQGALPSKTGIDEKRLLHWPTPTSMRIKGMGKEYAGLLARSASTP